MGKQNLGGMVRKGFIQKVTVNYDLKNERMS